MKEQQITDEDMEAILKMAEVEGRDVQHAIRLAFSLGQSVASNLSWEDGYTKGWLDAVTNVQNELDHLRFMVEPGA